MREGSITRVDWSSMLSTVVVGEVESYAPSSHYDYPWIACRAPSSRVYQQPTPTATHLQSQVSISVGVGKLVRSGAEVLPYEY